MILRVRTPEGGHFLVWSEIPAAAGRRVVVAFDYGQDECMVIGGVDEREVMRPKWTLEREFTPADEAKIRENATIAAGMIARFERLAQEAAPDFKIFAVRLSFGRRRLFVRYTVREARPDVSRAVADLQESFGVEVHVWRATLKDEIAQMGAIGYCGRVCCCSTWLVSSACGRVSAEKVSACGACGKRRCCLDFEK